MRLDAHQSYWQFGRSQVDSQHHLQQKGILAQDYLPEHIEPSLIENGFHGAIAQPVFMSVDETNYLAELTTQHRAIIGAVGWIDLTADNNTSALSDYQGKLNGFSWPLTNQTPDMLSATTLPINLGLLNEFNYTLDLTLHEPTPESVLWLARKNPEQTLVLDLSVLLSSQISSEHWRQLTTDLASAGNLVCKLKGLVEQVPAPDHEEQFLEIDPVLPFMDALLDSFGSDRLLYASGWPYCTLAATYDETYDITLALINRLSPAEQSAILGDNAAACYNLPT